MIFPVLFGEFVEMNRALLCSVYAPYQKKRSDFKAKSVFDDSLLNQKSSRCLKTTKTSERTKKNY